MKKLALLVLAALVALAASCGGTPGVAPYQERQIVTGVVGLQHIIFIGDSITFGSNDPAFNGFRLGINNELVADQGLGQIPGTVSFVFDGSTTSGAAPTNHHRGVSGWTVADHLADAPTQYGPGNPWPTVNIFSIYIGENDAATAADTDAFPTRYPALLTLFNSLTGCTRFVVSLLHVPTGDTTRAPRVAVINSELPGLWNELEALHPDWYLARATMNGLGIVSLHPSAAEFTLMVANYHAPFRAVLGYPM